MFEVFNPKQMYLIDSWNKTEIEAFQSVNADRDWVDDIDQEKYRSYFGGSQKDQKTFDNLYMLTRKKFEQLSQVKIIRKIQKMLFKIWQQN